jgi:hypothetical protein
MKFTLSVAMAALVAGMVSGQPAQAQNSDPLLRALLGLIDGDRGSQRDGARRGWNDDDDDDGYRRGGRWHNDNDDDDDDRGRGRSGDDDDD